MHGEPERLRDRAKHCRALAAVSIDPAMEDTLLVLAADFEEEAARLEIEAGEDRAGLSGDA